MSTITCDADQIRIDFTTMEAMMTRRRSITVPIGSIRDYEIIPGWTSEAHGFRYGLHIAGYWKLGIWKHPSGTKRLINMKRGMPILRIKVDRDQIQGNFDEIMVSTHETAPIVEVLSNATNS